MTMFKGRKRIFAEEPQSPDRWLKEPRNNHSAQVGGTLKTLKNAGKADRFMVQ